MERYLGGEEINRTSRKGICQGRKAAQLIPIVFTDARREIGIKELLNLIVQYTPSPVEAEPHQARDGRKVTS